MKREEIFLLVLIGVFASIIISNFALLSSINKLNAITAKAGSGGDTGQISFVVEASGDVFPPITYLIYPDDNYSTTDTSITFKYNTTDANAIANCSLVVDNLILDTSYSVSKNIEQNFTLDLITGEYNWSVNCTDVMNNQGNSSTRKLEITTAGGGAGKGKEKITAKKVYIPQEGKNLTFEMKLYVGVVKFHLSIGQYTMKIIDATANSVMVEIKPMKLDYIFNTWEEKAFDFNNDGTTDIFLTFNGFTADGKARFTLRKFTGYIEVWEEVPSVEVPLKVETSMIGVTILSLTALLLLILLTEYIHRKLRERNLHKVISRKEKESSE